MNNRYIKIGFSLLIGVYLSIVVFNNITDYNSNFQFVQKVTKMENVFSAPKNNWRSIDNPIVHHVFYITIILLETTIAFLMFWGAYKMVAARQSEVAVFLHAKKWTAWGLFLGVFLFFFVFLTVAGEWFLMWQSEKWNAQANAFSLTICFMLFLIFHCQSND